MGGSGCIAVLEAAPAHDVLHPIAPCARPRVRCAVGTHQHMCVCAQLWLWWWGQRDVGEGESHGQGAEVFISGPKGKLTLVWERESDD